MKLKLVRDYKKEDYTIGNLYYSEDDKTWTWICNTLEDKDRGLDCMMSEEEIKKIKIPNETAIPTGKYRLFLKQISPKFQFYPWAREKNGCVPRLLNVKGFSGILIHPGQNKNSTSGCIIVGYNDKKGEVSNSRSAYYKLWDIIGKCEDGTLEFQIV